MKNFLLILLVMSFPLFIVFGVPVLLNLGNNKTDLSGGEMYELLGYYCGVIVTARGEEGLNKECLRIHKNAKEYGNE